MFDVGPVFIAAKDAEEDIVILQGGTDSGKTYSVVQLFFHLGVFTRPPAVDPTMTILSESVPNSKKGPYLIAESIYNGNAYVRQQVANWDKGDRVITFKSGWRLEFVGATDEQAAKQGKRQYLFANEANGIAWPIFWQMAKRTRIRTFIDYNPTAPFWAHEKLIGKKREENDLYARVKLLISDHRHNPFLSQLDHDKTENIKDPELWRVYARGLTGKLEGLVYKNWIEIPDADFPKNGSAFGGCDFGYSNDPTALVKCVRKGNDIYVHQLCYEPEIVPQTLAKIILKQIGTEAPVYCDRDWNWIRQLRMLDVSYALPAIKGPGSIQAGISKVKEYNVKYTASSSAIRSELMKYLWLTDENGKPTNTPIDASNHMMDAIRYAIYTHFYRQ